MGTWESIAVGALALLIIYLFRPGLRAAMEKSRQAENKDWRAVIMPIVVVVLFVLMLIVIAQSTSTKHGLPADELRDTSRI